MSNDKLRELMELLEIADQSKKFGDVQRADNAARWFVHSEEFRERMRDKERIDWLTAPGEIDRHVYQTLGGEWCAQDDVISTHYGPTPRAAIDAAIAATEGE